MSNQIEGDSVRPANMADRAYDLILGGIVSGRLQPGDPIDDRALADQCGMSRTPVREALLQLSLEGLVNIVPRAGTYVARPDVKDLVAMLECLSLWEAAAAGLAARRISSSERAELAAVAARPDNFPVDGPQRIDAYEEHNATFHGVVYRAARNEVLADAIRRMRLRLSAQRRSFFENRLRIDQSIMEHAAVAKEILLGNELAAQEAMRAHISAGGQAFVEMVLRS